TVAEHFLTGLVQPLQAQLLGVLDEEHDGDVFQDRVEEKADAVDLVVGLLLGGDIAADPDQADDAALAVVQRDLARRQPAALAVLVHIGLLAVEQRLPTTQDSSIVGIEAFGQLERKQVEDRFANQL